MEPGMADRVRKKKGSHQPLGTEVKMLDIWKNLNMSRLEDSTIYISENRLKFLSEFQSISAWYTCDVTHSHVNLGITLSDSIT